MIKKGRISNIYTAFLIVTFNTFNTLKTFKNSNQSACKVLVTFTTSIVCPVQRSKLNAA